MYRWRFACRSPCDPPKWSPSFRAIFARFRKHSPSSTPPLEPEPPARFAVGLDGSRQLVERSGDAFYSLDNRRGDDHQAHLRLGCLGRPGSTPNSVALGNQRDRRVFVAEIDGHGGRWNDVVAIVDYAHIQAHRLRLRYGERGSDQSRQGRNKIRTLTGSLGIRRDASSIRRDASR